MSKKNFSTPCNTFDCKKLKINMTTQKREKHKEYRLQYTKK